MEGFSQRDLLLVCDCILDFLADEVRQHCIHPPYHGSMCIGLRLFQDMGNVKAALRGMETGRQFFRIPGLDGRQVIVGWGW